MLARDDGAKIEQGFRLKSPDDGRSPWRSFSSSSLRCPRERWRSTGSPPFGTHRHPAGAGRYDLCCKAALAEGAGDVRARDSTTAAASLSITKHGLLGARSVSSIGQRCLQRGQSELVHPHRPATCFLRSLKRRWCANRCFPLRTSEELVSAHGTSVAPGSAADAVGSPVSPCASSGRIRPLPRSCMTAIRVRPR